MRRWMANLVRPRYSLKALTMAAAACAVFFWVTVGLRPRWLQKQAARYLVANQLAVSHWLHLEAQDTFRPVIDRFSRDVAGTLPYQGQVKFVPLFKSSGPKLDAFEKRAVVAVAAGQQELWRRSWLGQTRYAAAVRLSRTCIGCHVVPAAARTASTPVLKPNQVAWVACVKLER